MAKKKTEKEEAEVVPVCVSDARNAAANINRIEIPTAINDRFKPQLTKVIVRLDKIAANMEKAIRLEATKDERETKRKERDEKRIDKLTKQLEAGTKKLKELKAKTE